MDCFILVESNRWICDFFLARTKSSHKKCSYVQRMNQVQLCLTRVFNWCSLLHSKCSVSMLHMYMPLLTYLVADKNGHFEFSGLFVIPKHTMYQHKRGRYAFFGFDWLFEIQKCKTSIFAGHIAQMNTAYNNYSTEMILKFYRFRIIVYSSIIENLRLIF